MNNDVELIMLDKHNMKPLIDYINELQCYKERIEKAVKYMNNTFDIRDVKDMFEIMNKLEDILKGEED